MAIGTLTVGVAANASKGIASLRGFRKEVKGVKADTTIASTSVKGLTSALTRVAGPLAAAAAGYMSARAFLTIAGDLDAVGEQSERLGVTGQHLLELRHAAKMTGVETELLDKSVGRLNLNIAKAATGTGAGVKALSELGVTVKDLNAQTPDEQFRTIADALQSVASQSDKARIATALFGKEGRTLLPTLDLGAAGLSKMAAEQRALMGTVSDAEIAQVAKFNDEMDRLSAQLGGIGRELVIDIAPAATDAIGALRDAMNWAKGKDTKGRDATNAGQLTFEEQAAQNMREARNKSRIAWETSKDPNVIAQRAAHNMARREKLQYGQAFNDNTVGAASKAIGAGAKGFLDLAGQLKTQAAELRKTTLGRSARGLNPLTGLAPIQMSDARREYMAGRGSRPGSDRIGPVSDRINNLVDAGGSDGYMALRANQRTARLNPADKSAPKIETNTKKSADTLVQMFDWFKKGPKPVEA
jgi:hypothetical protein